jgi:hypothetical protein
LVVGASVALLAVLALVALWVVAASYFDDSLHSYQAYFEFHFFMSPEIERLWQWSHHRYLFVV